MRLAFFAKRISESNVFDKRQQILPEFCQLILQSTQKKTNELIFMKFCPRCEKTVKRHYLVRCCGKNSSRGLEAILKLVYKTLGDRRGNIAC